MPPVFSLANDPPELAAVRRLAEDAARESWFAALAEPLTAAEREDAAAYLAALDLSAAAVEGVADWNAARAATVAADWDRRWWDREEALRQRCLAEAGARFGEAALLGALTEVITAAGDVVHGQAAVAATGAGVADAALVRVAAGAATQGCYQAALDRAVGGGTAFGIKYRLFAAGRWPLGIVGGRFRVF